MNQIILVLVLMILCHLIADYPLQGWLAQAKQRGYWQRQEVDVMYWNDWIPALIGHATMWGIIVFAPIMYFSWQSLNLFWIALPINIAIHFIVDDLKANRFVINLQQDQLAHLIQIVVTWLLWLRLIH